MVDGMKRLVYQAIVFVLLDETLGIQFEVASLVHSQGFLRTFLNGCCRCTRPVSAFPRPKFSTNDTKCMCKSSAIVSLKDNTVRNSQ